MSALRPRIKDNRLVRTGLFLAQNAVVAARSAISQPSSRPRPPGCPDYHLAAMIRVKDEARFLPEWVAHHLNVGVEHVFIYDNNSTDGTPDVMAPFVDRGLATCISWPAVPASPSCEYDFLARYGHASRWVAFFDADEFLFESSRGALSAALEENADRPAVAVCWRYFGSAGYETIPAGLVTERFDRADAVYNRHVKVIARPSQIVRHRNSHNFYYRKGRLAVTPEGDRAFGSFITPPSCPRLELRHYVYRSREDYDRKTRRGFVDASGAKDRSRRPSVADAEFSKRNDAHVAPDRRVVEATANRLRALGYPADLFSPSASGQPSTRRTPTR